MDRAIISLSGARAAYIGPSLGLAPHRNAAATIALAFGAPFNLTIAGQCERRIIALIPPGVRHHLRGAGPMAFVYLDALSDDVARISDAQLDNAARAIRRAPPLEPSVDALCAALGVPTRTSADRAIAAVARRMDEEPDAFTHARDAAAHAGLSPSHFQARFRRALGLPFRRYRLWRRMAAAVHLIAHGDNLTQAAHAAGFASSAHFSAAFKAMFGLAPSGLAGMSLRTRAPPLARRETVL